MDSGQVAELRNVVEDDIRSNNNVSSGMDAVSEQTIEAPSLSYDADIATDNEDASASKEIPCANESMDADSESTYSCINASSEGDTIATDGEQNFTCQNGSSINQNEINDNGDERQHTSQASEALSLVSSESIQVTNENGDDYLVPKIGVEFESEDHAYKCYNRYALMEGFSIRKDFVNRSKITGLVVSRRYTCHRQGYGGPTKREVNVNKPRKETRTGCLAHMTVTRQPNGNYRVIHFETRHNHEFVTSSTTYLLPSQKRISFVEAVEGESSSSPEPNGVPKLGMGFDSENHAYEFYNSYAARVGFSVRKDYVNRSKIDGVVASRRYTCFREGYRQKDKRDLKVKRPRKETRVGCTAQLVISRQVDGRYRVTHFEEHHNHDLVPPCKVRLLRSQKRPLRNNGIDVLGGSDTHPRTLTQLLLKGVGLEEEFGFDPVDHEMKLTSKRAWNLKQDEEEIIHHYFQSKKLKDPSLFYAVLLDVEDKMTNFFWADEKMLADYGDFGDVVCFDTTYDLNRDSRPLVPFYGINNHKQVVVFGAAFLYDDTAESFKWVFRTLMKAGSGKKPKTVLSDKNDAISEAIASEFPEAHQRLCTWQMYQNALKRLNEVVSSSDLFPSDLSGCIFNQEEEHFVNSWKIMLDSYSLWENEFLHGIFEEREKWALPYNKYMFSADIETALLSSEDSITSLKKYINFESHVLQFVKHFGRVVNEWRYKELEANYDMCQKMPRLMGDIIMLKELREVYTPVIFEMFHQEYESCLNIVIGQCVETASSAEYKVSLYGEVREYTVVYSCEGDSVACSCMKFEYLGILCSHALKVLDYRNVKIVPSQYVLKRWTRHART